MEVVKTWGCIGLGWRIIFWVCRVDITGVNEEVSVMVEVIYW